MPLLFAVIGPYCSNIEIHNSSDQYEKDDPESSKHHDVLKLLGLPVVLKLFLCPEVAPMFNNQPHPEVLQILPLQPSEPFNAKNDV